MYENSATGLKKAAHERMLNDKGRKIIKEQVGNSHFNNFDQYKNMHSGDAGNFDEEWNQVAASLGFKPNSNALEYGNGQAYP